MILKDIRYIIKRIIIGVGIALILMLIKGTLFLHVSALSSNTQTITASSHRVNDTVTGVTLSSRNIFGFTFYGADYNNTTGRVTYNTTNNLDTNNLYDISFVIYQSNAGKNGNSPVVTYNDNVCSVLPFGTLVSYDETSNLPLFSAFGGWTAPGAITSSGIQSFVEYYQMHPTYSTFSFGYMVSCSSVEVKDLNQTKVYTSQSTCGESSCYYGLSSEFWSRQSNESLIINNQNENTQKEIESQQVCNYEGELSSSIYSPGYVSANGTITSVPVYEEKYTSSFIKVNPSTQYTFKIAESSWSQFNTNNWIGIGEYSSDSFNSFVRRNTMANGSQNYLTFTTSATTNYVVLSARGLNNAITQFVPGGSANATKNCKNGNQALSEQNQQLQNTLNDSNTDSAQGQASGFFGDFQSDAHGLSGVITAPISFLQSLTASSCSPLEFELPFIHDEVSLPCMKPIYQQRFGVFFTLWQLITTGLISYNVCLNFYKKIRDLQNPNNDRIEVLNL